MQQKEIEQAILEGRQIKWRGHPVVQTKAHNFLVNVPINTEKYHSWKLDTVIQVYGLADFEKAPN